MKNKSRNNITNSRVGRIWPSEHLNAIEPEDDTKSMMNSNANTDQNPNQ